MCPHVKLCTCFTEMDFQEGHASVVLGWTFWRVCNERRWSHLAQQINYVVSGSPIEPNKQTKVAINWKIQPKSRGLRTRTWVELSILCTQRALAHRRRLNIGSPSVSFPCIAGRLKLWGNQPEVVASIGCPIKPILCYFPQCIRIIKVYSCFHF